MFSDYDEALPLAHVYAAVYAAARGNSWDVPASQREAEEACRHFIQTVKKLEDEYE